MIFISSLIVVSCSSVAQASSLSSGAQNESTMSSSSLSYYAPIKILNNSDLMNQANQEGWSGNGSYNNPYKIESIQFQSVTANGIAIDLENTSYYVIIQNDSFINLSGTGIYLQGVKNVKVVNNVIYQTNDIGVGAYNSNVTISDNSFVLTQNTSLSIYNCFCMITNNSFFNNYGYSIFVSNSQDTIHFVNNTFFNQNSQPNYNGIYFYKSSNIVFTSNTLIFGNAGENGGSLIQIGYCTNLEIANNFDYGYTIYITNSNYISIENNTLTYAYFSEYTSRLNSFTRNTVINSNNALYSLDSNYDNVSYNFFYNITSAIYLQYVGAYQVTFNYFENIGLGSQSSFTIYGLGTSQINYFYENNFINYYAPIDLGQTTNKFDNGSAGNYWQNYNGTDSNHDGIGDTPYIVYTMPSNFTVYDRYPLMHNSFTPNKTSLYTYNTTYTTISQEYASFSNYIQKSLPLQSTSTQKTVTQPYVTSTYMNGVVGGISTTTQSASNSANFSALINFFIIAGLLIIGGGALTYVAYEKYSVRTTNPNNVHTRSNRNNSQQSVQRSNQSTYPNIFRNSQSIRAQEQARSIKFCPSCNTQTDPSDHFCLNCGHKL